jgi:hypothetical protein
MSIARSVFHRQRMSTLFERMHSRLQIRNAGVCALKESRATPTKQLCMYNPTQLCMYEQDFVSDELYMG